MGDNRLTFGPVGFGAFKIGRNEKTKYRTPYPLPDQHAVDTLLNTLLDLGIDHIDTAPAYGSSEERIGAAIAYRRDEYTLSTKVGESFEDGRSTYDFSATAVRASVERSLRRLQTDVLDIVLVHSQRDDLRVLNETDVVETLIRVRDDGLAKRIGFSGYTAEAFASALPWSDAIMVEYHPDSRALEPVIAAAAEQGVGVLVKKGLASGRLDPADAIRFVLADPGVTSMVIGGLNAEHFRENVRIAREARMGRAAGGVV